MPYCMAETIDSFSNGKYVLSDAKHFYFFLLCMGAVPNHCDRCFFQLFSHSAKSSYFERVFVASRRST